MQLEDHLDPVEVKHPHRTVTVAGNETRKLETFFLLGMRHDDRRRHAKVAKRVEYVSGGCAMNCSERQTVARLTRQSTKTDNDVVSDNFSCR